MVVSVQDWLPAGAVTPGLTSQAQALSVTGRVWVPERVHPVGPLAVQAQAAVLVQAAHAPAVYALA